MSLVVSVQPFSITIANGSSSNTATISAVPTATSAIVWGGTTSDNTGTLNPSNDLGYLVLTNGTTVTATRAGTSGNLTLYGTVVQFKSTAIKSINSGTITMSTTAVSNTATVPAVTTGNSAVLFNGNTDTVNITNGGAQCYLSLTNSTTVTATRISATSATTTCAYTLIEFNSGVLNSSTQQVSVNMGSVTSKAVTITAVTMAQTWLAYGGDSSADNAAWSVEYEPYASLTATTTVTGKSTVAAGTSIINVTVVEFKAADIKSINRGTSTIINSGTNAFADATITAVDLSQAFASFCGRTGSTTAQTPNTINAAVNMNSSTDVRMLRNTAATTPTITPSWECIEFVPLVSTPYFYDLIGGM